MSIYFDPPKSVCQSVRRHTDFSIERLLKKECGIKTHSEEVKVNSESEFDCPQQLFSHEEKSSNSNLTLSWLNCTRFKPPKLQRCRKQGVVRKQHGRGPRIPFSPHQVAILERTFTKTQYMSSDSIAHLAKILCISETRVKIWFQNRRARLRRERDTVALKQQGIINNNLPTGALVCHQDQFRFTNSSRMEVSLGHGNLLHHIVGVQIPLSL